MAQLSGYVSEHSAYHHGEASLQQTIVGLAQVCWGLHQAAMFAEFKARTLPPCLHTTATLH